MQQVVVPQFLDVEDKIIGSVTVRQFIELVVGGLIEVILYRTLDFPAFVVFGLVILSLTVIVAFARINGQPFHLFLLNFIQTLRSPKLKVWQKSLDLKYLQDLLAQPPVVAKTALIRRPVTASKISEIALIVDTGGIYHGESGT